MYTGQLPTIYNRADWKFHLGIVDNDTGEDVDLTGCTMVICLRDDNGCVVLEGATPDEITYPATGVIQVWFTEATVHCLCPKTYNAGITLTGNGETVQFFAGSVPVVDGVVP